MRRTLLATAMALGLLFTACTPNDQPAEPTPAGPASPDDTQTQSSPGTETEATQPTAAVGGELVIGGPAGIPQLNPAIRTLSWEEVLFPLLWSSLSKTDSQGLVEPDLADWESNDDNTEWTFTLREEATFSNGKAMTADDVVNTLEYYRQPDTATQEANKLAPIEAVTAQDDRTVVISLNTPNALFPAALVWVKILDMESMDTIDTDPAVTGPYKVESFIPDNELVLVPNDQFHGDAPQLDKITFVSASDATAAATSLASGDLDVLWAVPPSDLDRFTDDSNLQFVLPEVPSQWPSWEVDTLSPPFDDVRARQALAYAVDREAILEAAYYEQGILSPTNNPLGTSNPWFSDEGLTDYSYDLEKARELFAEAGVTEGTELVWWGVAGAYPEWNTSGQILQASLAEIGITLRIDNNDISTWVDAFYPAGKSFPGMVVPNFQSTPVEPAYSLNFLIKGRCECNWDSPEFQAAYDAALGTEEGERKDAWAEVQRIVNEEVPVIVPIQATVVTAARSDLQGMWVEGGGQLHLEDAYMAAS